MDANQYPACQPEQALAFRLEAQHLDKRLPPGSLAEAAAPCAIQNTPPGSAELALHARVAGLAPGAVKQALEVERSLLQAWSLRASPHIFRTADAPIFTLGLLPGAENEIRAFIWGVVPALEQTGISAVRLLERTAEAFESLAPGQALTKDELGIELADRIAPRLEEAQLAHWRSPSVYAPGQSLGESMVRFALPLLALQGRLCHAERRGSQAYLMHTRAWLGQPLPGGDAQQHQAGLARRYLHSYGPSTPEHFAAWAGIGPQQAERAWAQVAQELVPLRLENRAAWLLAEDLERLRSASLPEGARLLPPGDPLLNLRDRSTLIADTLWQRRAWLRSGSPGVVLLDGRAAGLWRPQKQGQRLALTVELFGELADTQRAAVQEEAESMARLRGCKESVVRWSGDG